MKKNSIKHYVDLELIKAIMASKQINQKDLATLMCVTLPTIKKFLGGADQSNMSSIMLYKLAIALETPAQSLLHKDYY